MGFVRSVFAFCLAATSVASFGVETLESAAVDGDSSAVKEIVRRGADINQRFGSRERTALQLAAAKGRIDAAEVLIKMGANIDLQDKNGATALTLAVENEQLDVVKLLISFGANPDIKNRDGRTALRVANRLNSGSSATGRLEKISEMLSRYKYDPSLAKMALEKYPTGAPALERHVIIMDLADYGNPDPEVQRAAVRKTLERLRWQIFALEPDRVVARIVYKHEEYRAEIRFVNPGQIRIAYIRWFEGRKGALLTKIKKELSYRLLDRPLPAPNSNRQ